MIIPMLGRAESVEPLLDSLLKEEPDIRIEPVFVVSPEDHEVREAADATGFNFIVMGEACQPGDFARKTNAAFEVTEGEWVFLGASDLRFHPGWAREAIVAGGDEFGVVGTDDMGNPTVMRGLHSTHSLVRRSYIDEFGGGWDGPGVVYHEGYFHQYVDTELVTAAQARGRWVFAHRSKVEHLHPFWKKGEMDSTYKRALQHPEGRRDAMLFRQRSRQHAKVPARGLRSRSGVRAAPHHGGADGA